MNNGKERIAYWDNLRFFMVLLMVIGHFVLVYYDQSHLFRSIHLFIYAFHMPVLMFVSGFFFHREKARKLCLFYISCALVCKVFLSLPDLLMGNAVSFWLLYEGDIPWFFFSLGCYCLLMPVIDRFDRRYVLVFSILLACLIGYDKSSADFLTAFRTVVFFPFYYAGTLCRTGKKPGAAETVRKVPFVVYPLAAAVLVAWGLLCCYRRDFVAQYLHIFKGRFSYSEQISGYGFLARLCCYLVTVLTGLSVMVLCPRKRIKWISQMGSRTINVYFWHWILYKLLSGPLCFSELFYSLRFGKAVYLGVGVVICCVTASLRLFDWPMNKIREMVFSD